MIICSQNPRDITSCEYLAPHCVWAFIIPAIINTALPTSVDVDALNRLEEATVESGFDFFDVSLDSSQILDCCTSRQEGIDLPSTFRIDLRCIITSGLHSVITVALYFMDLSDKACSVKVC